MKDLVCQLWEFLFYSFYWCIFFSTQCISFCAFSLLLSILFLVHNFLCHWQVKSYLLCYLWLLCQLLPHVFLACCSMTTDISYVISGYYGYSSPMSSWPVAQWQLISPMLSLVTMATHPPCLLGMFLNDNWYLLCYLWLLWLLPPLVFLACLSMATDISYVISGYYGYSFLLSSWPVSQWQLISPMLSLITMATPSSSLPGLFLGDNWYLLFAGELPEFTLALV